MTICWPLLREPRRYNTITIAYQVYCAYVGTMAWYDGTAASIGGSAQARLYATSSVFEKLGSVARVQPISPRAMNDSSYAVSE